MWHCLPCLDLFTPDCYLSDSKSLKKNKNSKLPLRSNRPPGMRTQIWETSSSAPYLWPCFNAGALQAHCYLTLENGAPSLTQQGYLSHRNRGARRSVGSKWRGHSFRKKSSMTAPRTAFRTFLPRAVSSSVLSYYDKNHIFPCLETVMFYFKVF